MAFHMVVSRLSLLLAVIFALSLFTVQPSRIVSSGTIVDHDIVGNVTWSKSGSPYIIRGYISVIGSLTIEPGVVVIIESGGIAVSGKLIAMGSQREPVVLNASEAFNVDVKSGSEIYIANTITEKTLNISSDNSAVNIVNISGSSVVISKSISSKILIDGAKLDAIWLNQTVINTTTTYVGGSKIQIVPNEYIFFKDSEITIRNAYLIYGFSSNVYIERCRLFIDNVTALLGISAPFIANRSYIVINNAITLAITMFYVYDTDVAITNSIIINGRGILVHWFMNIVRDRVTFIANYNTFYNLNPLPKIIPGKNAIVVLSVGNGAFFDLKYNFWGDTSYYINPPYIYPSNVTIIVEPRLSQPATSLLQEMDVKIDPPIPALGRQLSIDMQPKYPDMVYVLFIFYTERWWAPTYIMSRNGSFTVTISENMLLVAVAYSKPLKYIFGKEIEVRPVKSVTEAYTATYRETYTETVYRVSTVTITSTKTVPVIITQPQPTTVTLTHVERAQGVPIELAIAIVVIAVAATAATMRVLVRR
ncbi:MAG: hypothetical protein QXE01_02600 [Sulfolobales archaeon]